MYIDILIVLNFIVDFLLIMATNRLCGYPTQWKRSILAAALGGVYGGVCVLPDYSWLGNFAGRFGCLCIISAIAFGVRKSAAQRSILFVFLTMALGGFALAFNKNGFWAILLCAAAVVLMCTIGFRGKVGMKYIPVSIRYDQGDVRFVALRDTGNTLTDPITGQQVLVASSTIAKKVLGISRSELENPIAYLNKVSGARLIPYHAVGTEGGMLLAKRFEDVTVGSWHGSCLIAFVPHELGKGECYEALTGGA